MGPLVVLAAALALPTQQTHSIRVHVQSQTGKAVGGQSVSLSQTSDDKPLRSFGYFRGNSLEPIVATKQTDSHGNLVFENMRPGVAFAITTDVGLFEPMTYFGAVHAGANISLTLRNDRKIIGLIRSTIPGNSLAGIKVDLMDTGYAHMMGYPGTVIRTATTDSKGRFQFTKLPPCTFRVEPGAPGARAPYCLDFKVDKGAWVNEAVSFSKSSGHYSDGPGLLLTTPIKRIDFRFARPATIKVDVVNPGKVPLYGLSIEVDGSGFDIGYGYDLFFPTPPGVHKVTLSKDWPHWEKAIATITLREGEAKRITVTLPPGVQGRKTKQFTPQPGG